MPDMLTVPAFDFDIENIVNDEGECIQRNLIVLSINALPVPGPDGQPVQYIDRVYTFPLGRPGWERMAKGLETGELPPVVKTSLHLPGKNGQPRPPR